MTATPDPPARPVTAVAVGVLIRADGAVLMADRPAGKPYAGYWEFPGGKVEPGETVAQALARELDEELGVAIGASTPWVTMEYAYPHAYVRLHFRRVHEWTGEPQPREGQQLRFLPPGQAPPAPLLPAAVPALRWVELPTVCAVSPGTATTAVAAMQWLENLLARGLRMVVWHEPLLADEDAQAAWQAASELARMHGAQLLRDARGPAPSSGEGAACFLGSEQLRACLARPAADWLGAGIRDAGDFVRAVALGCDFAVLESAAAAGLLAEAPLPTYLPAPLALEPLQRAQAAGAHGLMVRIDA